MRFDSSITAITWLPFGVLDALPNLPLGIAVAHYDERPPIPLGDLDELRDADRFREANELRAWIEVEDGDVIDYGHEGRSVLAGSALDPDQIAFPAIEFPVLRPPPSVGDGWVRFQQTVGGRIGLPVPQRVRGKPYFHIGSAQAWTTLELVIRADGTSDGRLVAASPFPSHTLYDAGGNLREEHPSADFEGWARDSLEDTPWAGGELEDELDRIALRSQTMLDRRRLRAGETLVKQGDCGEDMFMLLDGVLHVEIDGAVVAQVGSGALLGELALLGDGTRTATLRAVRPSRVAVLRARELAGSRLAELVRAERAGAA